MRSLHLPRLCRLAAPALRSWRSGELVSPAAGGGIQHHKTLARGMAAAMVAAGMVDAAEEAKYSGLHALGHFFASWCINPKERGGRGLSPKVVQEWLGHSSIKLTLDVYGHLFKSQGDGDEQAAAEKALFG